jgi:xanthine dehydrogenase small subunit
MPALAGHFPDLAEMMRRLGSTQIRNAGTLGGNIANGSPIGDSAPALIALGASLVLRRGSGERAIPLEKFFVEYGKQDRAKDEFVSRIEIPLAKPEELFRCYKVSKRFDQDITSCLGAFRLELDGNRVAGIRIAYGGMAGTPKRATSAEAALMGGVWNEPAIEAAVVALSRDFQPIGDMRASAAYRARIGANLLRKFFVETTEPLAETRVVPMRRSMHARA